jgi:hypothetical protein
MEILQAAMTGSIRVHVSAAAVAPPWLLLRQRQELPQGAVRNKGCS